ncbi:hypothetical protein R5A26_26650, partial [Streptomyces prunicolor]|nr:hypothetical protein [Streptomyces prunicolor]
MVEAVECVAQFLEALGEVGVGVMEVREVGADARAAVEEHSPAELQQAQRPLGVPAGQAHRCRVTGQSRGLGEPSLGIGPIQPAGRGSRQQ